MNAKTLLTLFSTLGALAGLTSCETYSPPVSTYLPRTNYVRYSSPSYSNSGSSAAQASTQANTGHANTSQSSTIAALEGQMRVAYAESDRLVPAAESALAHAKAHYALAQSLQRAGLNACITISAGFAEANRSKQIFLRALAWKDEGDRLQRQIAAMRAQASGSGNTPSSGRSFVTAERISLGEGNHSWPSEPAPNPVPVDFVPGKMAWGTADPDQ